jgi:succinyl-CoA synthetase beta subunit
MKIHEYQAKQLLGQHGLPVPLGIPVLRSDALDQAVQDVIGASKSQTVVVKAQIHAGGRGKGGGVKVVKGVEAARAAAGQILGKVLTTHQTGPEGRVVRRLLIEEGVSIARELYAGILVDRGCSRVVVMVSAAGGMEIEEVAARTPEAIVKEHVDPALGLAAFQARKLSYALGLTGTAARNATSFLQKLYRLSWRSMPRWSR